MSVYDSTANAYPDAAISETRLSLPATLSRQACAMASGRFSPRSRPGRSYLDGAAARDLSHELPRSCLSAFRHPPFVPSCLRASVPSAFTLIELLVVIAIVALLIALLLPAIKRARAVARNIQCMSQERQMTIATLAYINEHDEYFPMGASANWDVGTWWPSNLRPYLGTLAVLKCSEAFGPRHWNTYMANGQSWMFVHEGEIGRSVGGIVGGPTQLGELGDPTRVVCFFESIRDWTGHLDDVWPFHEEIADYQMKFEYYPAASYQRLTGGRHFRRSGASGSDPWGTDNVAMVDGHVVSHVSFEWLVETGPPGAFYSYPFNDDSQRPIMGWGERPADAEFWTVPWW